MQIGSLLHSHSLFELSTALQTATASLDAAAANVAAGPPPRQFRRLGDRCDSLRRGRLPPPSLAGVAQAPAASSLGGSRNRRRNSRPVLQALVAGATCGHTLPPLHSFHALSSSIWSNFSTLSHRCSRSKLEQVCIPRSAFLYVFVCVDSVFLPFFILIFLLFWGFFGVCAVC